MCGIHNVYCCFYDTALFGVVSLRRGRHEATYLALFIMLNQVSKV